jgi:hypothetical protein
MRYDKIIQILSKKRKMLIKPIILLIIFTLISCSSHSIIVDPDANVKSSLEEISKHENNKAEIVKKLPTKIGNMELYNVADYSKKYLMGIDLGYGIFYDLKNNRKGSGNIFLYKRHKINVEEGLTKDALSELFVERKEIEKSKDIDTTYSSIQIEQINFYKMSFVTPPDSKNMQYYCFLFITGYNNVYLKLIFYYPINSEYGEEETEKFMSSLIRALKIG